MTSDSEEEEEVQLVRVVGTTIYFSSEVTIESVLDLVEKLKKLEIQLLKQAIEFPGYAPQITLFIHSSGGDAYAGLSGMDHIRNSKVPVKTVATGCCASAATFLLLGGSIRSMTPHTYILIHQVSTEGFWGKFEDLKDEMSQCKRMMTMIKSIYTQYTNIPNTTLNTFMKRDVYLHSEDCMRHHIVTELACP